MKRTIAYLFAVFALLAAPLSAEPLPPATVVRLDVTNTSNVCAWVSLYLRRNQTSWQMEVASESKPFDIKSGAKHTFYVRFTNSYNVPLPAEIKALVAFRNGKDCSGSVVASKFGSEQVFDGKIFDKVDMSSTLSGPPYAVTVTRP